MKTLVIYAHPSREGHHGYFLSLLEKYLSEKKTDFETIDLYRDGYDPRLSKEEIVKGYKAEGMVRGYQEKIIGASHLIFIYPTWWQGSPAILKGFFDRVLSSQFGFMYKRGLPIGLLKGKRAAVFSASGAPRWYNWLILRDRAIRMVTRDTLQFCGIRCRGFSLGSARKFTELRKGKVEKVFKRSVRYLYR